MKGIKKKKRPKEFGNRQFSEADESNASELYVFVLDHTLFLLHIKDLSKSDPRLL